MEEKLDDKGRSSLWYKVDIDPEEKEFIRKVKRKDIPYVSVQVLVSDVRQKESVEFGNFIEADIKEGLELSSVLIPGERETFGYITEEKFAESFTGKKWHWKEQLTDEVEENNKKQKSGKQDSGYVANQSIIAPKEDISTIAGDGLIQQKELPKKIKKVPDNKLVPDIIPKRMISMQGLDKLIQKKTNIADETQEDQEAEYKYKDKPAVKYYKKGGNNIPGVPLKGYKAESISNIVSCCSKPMVVLKNSLKNTALFCNKCNKTITKIEKFWKNKQLKEGKLMQDEQTQMDSEQEDVMSSPVPSTSPEFEQILIKLQELEQRLGDLELSYANKQQGKTEQEPEQVDLGQKYEKLINKSVNELKEKLLKSLKNELSGVPEIKKGLEEQDKTEDVPSSQGSEIDYSAGGKKTGAPVAGEETGLNREHPGKEDEDKAVSKVPKPLEELPKLKKKLAQEEKMQTQKQQVDKDPSSTDDAGLAAPEKPKEMEDEEDTKMKPNSSAGFEERYKYIQSKLSGRKSVVSAHAYKEDYKIVKDKADGLINQYLKGKKIFK